jgi:hypothetical protein
MSGAPTGLRSSIRCARPGRFGFGSGRWEPRLVVTLIVIARAFELLLYRPLADRSDLRRRARNVRSDAMAKTPSRIALAGADETHKGVVLDATTPLAVDAVSANRDAVASPQREPALEQPRKPDEPKRILPEIHDPEPFRIQFLGGPASQGPEILKEVDVCAANVFAAYRAADNGPWPPGATAFRLLDGGGRDVFWRRRPERR